MSKTFLSIDNSINKYLIEYQIILVSSKFHNRLCDIIDEFNNIGKTNFAEAIYVGLSIDYISVTPPQNYLNDRWSIQDNYTLIKRIISELKTHIENNKDDKVLDLYGKGKPDLSDNELFNILYTEFNNFYADLIKKDKDPLKF